MVHSGASASMPSELVARLESATAGSRELDAEIAVATRWPAMGNIKHWIHDEEMEPRARGYVGFKNLKDNPYEFETPQVTTSLDAALALAERVLLGWRMHCLQDQDGIYQSDNTLTRWSVGLSEKRGPGNVLSYAPTPALALCIAILTAVEGKPTEEGAGSVGMEPKAE